MSFLEFGVVLILKNSMDKRMNSPILGIPGDIYLDNQ
jgi:hypothetical protein